ncbi:MAG: hypothetical protein HYZ75_05870 [Elusimicrobia bacterium]|nr:hypothetical protein [Elusimicrobiota bacterium]
MAGTDRLLSAALLIPPLVLGVLAAAGPRLDSPGLAEKTLIGAHVVLLAGFVCAAAAWVRHRRAGLARWPTACAGLPGLAALALSAALGPLSWGLYVWEPLEAGALEILRAQEAYAAFEGSGAYAPDLAALGRAGLLDAALAEGRAASGRHRYELLPGGGGHRLRLLRESGKAVHEWTEASLPRHVRIPRPLDPRHLELAKGVLLPAGAELEPFAARGERERALIAILTDPRTWAEVFAQVEDRTGLARPPRITLRLGDAAPGGWAELGQAEADGEGVAISMTMDSLSTMVLGGRRAARGELIQTLAHEVTHAYQIAACPKLGPRWVFEGMADFGAMALHTIGSQSRELSDLADPGTDVYGRGQLFFMWVNETRGRPAAKELIRHAVLECQPLELAASEALGTDWLTLSDEERAWSAAFLKDYDPTRFTPRGT